MSINDPVEVVYSAKRETYWLRQGREAYYDNARVLREWEDPEPAYEWAKENITGVAIIPFQEAQ